MSVAVKWEWESIDNYTQRTKVVGGWLVKIDEPVVRPTDNGYQDGWDWRPSLAFVPDPEHAWTPVTEAQP